MKKILLISKEWFPYHKTGLGISSKIHHEIFLNDKFDVKTVSIDCKNNTDYCINFSNFFNFIINFFLIKKKANQILDSFQPDIIIVESLQTWISELFLILSKNKKTKLVLISHGISILPYKLNFKYIFRFFLYVFYLPFLFFFVSKIDLFFSLNHTNKSNRHIDEKIFKLIGKGKIIKYFNTSRYEKELKINKKKNPKIITIIGYVSEIKNQKEFLKIAEELDEDNLQFKIIYQSYDKRYLNLCKKYCLKKKLININFIDANFENIKKILSESYLLINSSITEVFPLSIVEAINLGTPFVSYNTGNISYIKGGFVVENIDEMIKTIQTLTKNDFFYEKLQNTGKEFYKKNLSYSLLKKRLNTII